jgi:two-component system, OmpR family, phosphate regulon response regulator PhoB
MDQTVNEFIKTQKALIVEDEQAISQLLKINLQQMGFEVDVFSNANAAAAQLANQSYALCLLDWMLPGMQGIDFLKEFRPVLKKTKIMMVTAKADADSIVEGLDSGADDYLPKPFDSRVLAARVRQLMRSLYSEVHANTTNATAPAEEMTEVEFDGLSLHLTKHIVKLKGQDVHLTPSEFKLLAELFKAKGQVLTRDRLIDLIQGQDVSVTGRTIDTHVFALRKKIGEWSRHIETIRGVGYRILISVQDESEPIIL